jgi:hypothetical protein
MPTAKGTFEVVSAGEEAYHEADGEPRLTHASGEQRFSGAIEGEGSIEWLMCYLPNGDARFVGLERIAGTVDGHRGSFMLEADGRHDGTGSRSTWRVIEGSGSGDLAGITGQGGFEAPGGKIVSYHLEYELGTGVGEPVTGRTPSGAAAGTA